MKNIKRFLREHRIFMILMSIVIVCFILIATLLLNLFGSFGGDDPFDGRIQPELRENNKFTKEREAEIDVKIKEHTIVKSSKITIKGQTMYIKLTFNEGTDLLSAQNVAIKLLEVFNESEKAYYDFHFTLKQDKNDASDGFIIEGAKNKSGSGLVWNNNRPVTAVS